METREHLPFVDWMKAIGMTLILLGHLSGAYTNNLAPPIYPKQLGVAFFIFVAGHSLARERRSIGQVIVRRLFEVFFWGISIATIVSVWTRTVTGHWAPSNFLPFIGGVNVAFDSFPANPTTWYIGTYIHLVLVWCLIRQVRISAGAVCAIAAIEIVVRVILMRWAGLYIAYMVLPNWLTPLALGMYAGQVDWKPRIRPIWTAVALTGGAGWAALGWSLVAARTFPFMMMRGPAMGSLVLTSALVTIVYDGWTLMAFSAFQRAGLPRPVRFVARHTLMIFIAHMPMFYWVDPHLRGAGIPYPMRSFIEVATSLVILPLLSEALHRLLPVHSWRDALSRRLAESMRPATV